MGLTRRYSRIARVKSRDTSGIHFVSGWPAACRRIAGPCDIAPTRATSARVAYARSARARGSGRRDLRGSPPRARVYTLRSLHRSSGHTRPAGCCSRFHGRNNGHAPAHLFSRDEENDCDIYGPPRSLFPWRRKWIVL